MDISGIVNYSALFTLKLKNPATDEELGIEFDIRSDASDDSKRVLREHLNKNLERHVKGKLVKADVLEKQEIEKAASYIAAWRWGSNPKTGEQATYKGEVPTLSMKTAIAMLDEQSWMFSQVTEAARKIENFSPASPTT